MGPIALFIGAGIGMGLVLPILLAYTLGGGIGGALLGIVQWRTIHSLSPFDKFWPIAQAISWLLGMILYALSIGFILILGLIIGIISGGLLYFIERDNAKKKQSYNTAVAIMISILLSVL